MFFVDHRVPFSRYRVRFAELEIPLNWQWLHRPKPWFSVEQGSFVTSAPSKPTSRPPDLSEAFSVPLSAVCCEKICTPLLKLKLTHRTFALSEHVWVRSHM